MNLYTVQGEEDFNNEYVVLASSKERAEFVFLKKKGIKADPEMTWRVVEGQGLNNAKLLIDDLS